MGNFSEKTTKPRKPFFERLKDKFKKSAKEGLKRKKGGMKDARAGRSMNKNINKLLQGVDN